MKHHQEHPLLNELLSGQEVAGFREASLHQALTTLRHARRRRKVLRGVGVAVLPVLVVTLVLLIRTSNPVSPAPSSAAPLLGAVTPDPARSSSVEIISDEDLLSLFPNQPLALVGPRGSQQLVFLDRPVPN